MTPAGSPVRTWPRMVGSTWGGEEPGLGWKPRSPGKAAGRTRDPRQRQSPRMRFAYPGYATPMASAAAGRSRLATRAALRHAAGTHQLAPLLHAQDEVGRASGREGGCQYV